MIHSPKASAEPKGSATLFAALGDETRLRLLARLSRQGPMSITRLTTGTSITRQAITKHLRLMEKAGLVHSTWEGRENIWQLKAKRVEEARRYLDIISRQWDTALARLRAYVEE